MDSTPTDMDRPLTDMDSTPNSVSRRGLLAAVAAGSAVALAGPTAVLAAPLGTTPLGPAGSLVLRDRIATALTRQPGGRLAASAYTVDFHERLSDWLRFWWANAPGGWRAPFEVVGEATPSGRAYLLTALRFTAAGRLTTGFAATTKDPAYWATLASLHRFFPLVRPELGQVRIEDGQSGFVGSAEQLAFVREARQHVWRGESTIADVTSRAGWHTFTKATLRRGLGTESS